MQAQKLLVKKLNNHSYLPKRSTEGSACYDLHSPQNFILESNVVTPIPLGISIQLPYNTCGIIKERSGLAKKEYIEVKGGVIDEDYRGEVIVLLKNTNSKSYQITEGDKIAQLLIIDVKYPIVEEVEYLSNTIRGDGKFGSTGK